MAAASSSAESRRKGRSLVEVVTKSALAFEELSLSDAVLRGLRDAGFLSPSPIQAAAIPLGRFGIDLIARAKSGTGKTAAFVVVALERVQPTRKGPPEAIIVSPTREIAVQTADVCRQIGAHTPLRCATLIGGSPVRNDVGAISNSQIACGTPGRLVALLLCEALVGEQVKSLPPARASHFSHFSHSSRPFLPPVFSPMTRGIPLMSQRAPPTPPTPRRPPPVPTARSRRGR